MDHGFYEADKFARLEDGTRACTGWGGSPLFCAVSAKRATSSTCSTVEATSTPTGWSPSPAAATPTRPDPGAPVRQSGPATLRRSVPHRPTSQRCLLLSEAAAEGPTWPRSCRGSERPRALTAACARCPAHARQHPGELPTNRRGKPATTTSPVMTFTCKGTRSGVPDAGMPDSQRSTSSWVRRTPSLTPSAG